MRPTATWEPDLRDALCAALACEAISSPKPGRDLDAPALAAAGVADYRRVPVNTVIARKRVGPILAEAVGWLTSALPLARAYTMETRAGPLLAFKGTAPPPKPGDPDHNVAAGFEWRTGWMMNVSMGVSQQVQDALREAGYVFPGLVHGGFAALLTGYDWEHIRTFAEDARRSGGLVVCGHSQGGAVAALAAKRLAEEGIPVRAVYTFGAPRPGDDTFKAAYDLPHWRFENVADPVPLLCPPPKDVRDVLPRFVQKVLFGGEPPPDPVEFRHVGRLALMNDRRVVVDAEVGTFDRLAQFVSALATADGRQKSARAHSPAAYTAGLQRALDVPSHRLSLPGPPSR